MISKKVQPTDSLYYEINKLKVGDYSSYTTFYEITSPYLYQYMCNVMATINTTENYVHDLFNMLYDEIYVSISFLIDNADFYSWAGQKVIEVILTKSKYFSDLNSMGDILSETDDETNVEEYAMNDFEPFIPEYAMYDAEINRIIKEQIDSLPSLVRLFIYEYYLNDMSVSEISAKFGIDRKIVKSNLGLVKKQLKEMFVIRSRVGEVNSLAYERSYKMYSMSQLPIVWLSFYEMIGKPDLGTSVMFGTGAVAAASISNVTVNSNEAVGTIGGASVGTVGGNAASTGMAIGTAVTTGASAGGVVAATKVRIGIGAKIAIGVSVATVAIGGGIGASYLIKNKEKPGTETTITSSTDITTENVTVEIVEEITEEIASEETFEDITGDNTTEEVNSENITEEITTEEQLTEDHYAECISEQQAYDAVVNYCYNSNPGLYDLNSEEYLFYWDVSEVTDTYYKMHYRAYTGAHLYYYVDIQTGYTTEAEYVPGIIEEETPTGVEFNAWDYL